MLFPIVAQFDGPLERCHYWA